MSTNLKRYVKQSCRCPKCGEPGAEQEFLVTTPFKRCNSCHEVLETSLKDGEPMIVCRLATKPMTIPGPSDPLCPVCKGKGIIYGELRQTVRALSITPCATCRGLSDSRITRIGVNVGEAIEQARVLQD